MSPKKRSEVESMCPLIDYVARECGVQRIMDLGSGQAYLDIALALEYGYTIIGVDEDEIQTSGASRNTRDAKKHFPGKTLDLHYINRRVEPHEGFDDLLSSTVDAGTDSSGTECSHFGIVGLHTCGDLAAASLEHFLNAQNARFLVNVGCCYNCLSDKGFPLSDHLFKVFQAK